jgi:hypothetical protein
MRTEASELFMGQVPVPRLLWLLSLVLQSLLLLL